MNKRLGLMRTIEHKRTISSEQGHYHQRKLTMENCDVKSTRPVMQGTRCWPCPARTRVCPGPSPPSPTTSLIKASVAASSWPPVPSSPVPTPIFSHPPTLPSPSPLSPIPTVLLSPRSSIRACYCSPINSTPLPRYVSKKS